MELEPRWTSWKRKKSLTWLWHKNHHLLQKDNLIFKQRKSPGKTKRNGLKHYQFWTRWKSRYAKHNQWRSCGEKHQTETGFGCSRITRNKEVYKDVPTFENLPKLRISKMNFPRYRFLTWFWKSRYTIYNQRRSCGEKLQTATGFGLSRITRNKEVYKAVPTFENLPKPRIAQTNFPQCFEAI